MTAPTRGGQQMPPETEGNQMSPNVQGGPMQRPNMPNNQDEQSEDGNDTQPPNMNVGNVGGGMVPNENIVTDETLGLASAF